MRERAPSHIRNVNPEIFYRRLGEDLAGVLRCGTCGKREEVGQEQAGRYVHHGWPLCCGSEMDLITRRNR